MTPNRKSSGIKGMALAIAAGIGGGVFGAFVSAANPTFVASATRANAKPVSAKPGTPILLFDKGATRAVVRVDRNGLILLNFTTRSGHNRIALGVLGDDKVAVGVLDSKGQPRMGIALPTDDATRPTLLLDRTHGQVPPGQGRSS